MERPEKWIKELEERTTEITQSEQQKEDRMQKKKKMNRVSGTCGTITKDNIFVSSESQRRGESAGVKKYSKK